MKKDKLRIEEEFDQEEFVRRSHVAPRHHWLGQILRPKERPTSRVILLDAN